MNYRRYHAARRRQAADAIALAARRRDPESGYGLQAGVNRPTGCYATPQFAARSADPWDYIYDYAAGARIGRAADYKDGGK